jgi:hypothetical protein
VSEPKITDCLTSNQIKRMYKPFRYSTKAFFYYRGKITELDGDHPNPEHEVRNGKVRIRFIDYGADPRLSIQARSQALCKKALAAYLDSDYPFPEHVCLEWPGTYRTGCVFDFA